MMWLTYFLGVLIMLSGSVEIKGRIERMGVSAMALVFFWKLCGVALVVLTLLIHTGVL